MQYKMRRLHEPHFPGLKHLPEGGRLLPEDWSQLPQFTGVVGRLYGWIGIHHGPTGPGSKVGSFNVLELAENGRSWHYELPGPVGFFVVADINGLIVAGVDCQLMLIDFTCDDGYQIIAKKYGIDLGSRNMINDGESLTGWLVFGTKDTSFRTPSAKLYGLNYRSGWFGEIGWGQICSNGKVELDHAEHWVDFADTDSALRVIRHKRLFDNGLLQDLGVILDFTHRDDVPDGFVAGRHDEWERPSSLVISFFHPGRPENGVIQECSIGGEDAGELLNEWIVVGSPRVTCPAIVPYNGNICVVTTTAIEGGNMSDYPNAGCLMVGDSPFTDLPPQPPPFPARLFR